MFTASGKGSLPLLFVPTSVRKRGADNPVHVFLCICVGCQCWSISGWVPGFANYHFNHYPQRRGWGMKCPKKIVKILLPMFRQGCLVFTGKGSRCERERKLWCVFQTEEESAFFTHQSSMYLFPDGNAALWGKGTLEQTRKAGGFGWIRHRFQTVGPDHLMPCIKS